MSNPKPIKAVKAWAVVEDETLQIAWFNEEAKVPSVYLSKEEACKDRWLDQSVIEVLITPESGEKK